MDVTILERRTSGGKEIFIKLDDLITLFTDKAKNAPNENIKVACCLIIAYLMNAKKKLK